MASDTFDIAIVGAGPAGLSLAAALEGAGLSLAFIERASRASVAEPTYDGREIALTHDSVASLAAFGAWERIGADFKSPLLRARVFDGPSPYTLDFHDERASEPMDGEPLAHLTPNSEIRRALWAVVEDRPDVTFRFERTAIAAHAKADEAILTLDGGDQVRARLVVAADTRFSALRRQQGITAEMRDFEKLIMVARVAHEVPHEHVATEWFDYGQTIAMLPLAGDVSSIVVTMAEEEMRVLMALAPAAFSEEMTRRTQDRWGRLTLVSERYAYPLVAVFANRFVSPRFALLGDAAVGMHPVTAHGFNFGLKGARTLAAEILAAPRDPGAPGLLMRYERAHKVATYPLFLATNAIAGLYTDERLPSRLVRKAGLRLMNAVAPVRRVIEAQLRGA